jgi:hypothetical protein
VAFQRVIEDLEARFGELVAAARSALEAAAADPWVKGSRGQLVAHPGFAVAVRLDTVAVKIATEILARRQLPDESPSGFDDLDDRVLDRLSERRRARNRERR